MMERWPSGLRPRSRKAVSCQKRDRGFKSHPLRQKIASKSLILATNIFGEMSELAEGARLEIVCAVKSGTEGSNPSLSAI